MITKAAFQFTESLLGALCLCIASGCGDGGANAADMTAGAGAADTSGSGGSMSSGGSGPDLGPRPEAGEAFTETEAPAMQWSYVAIDGMRCRNGEPTGVMVNRNPASDKVMLWLEEGQACFNTFGCNTTYRLEGFGPGVPPSDNPFALYQMDADGNPYPGADAVEIISSRFEAELSVYNRSTPNNPFSDWSYVFVPYCSGDIHLGDADDVVVAGQTYQFKGWPNTTLVLERMAATWPSPSQFVVAGSSAGGIGAVATYPKVRAFFPDSEVIAIDDSGMPHGIAQCFLDHVSTIWNLHGTVFADCAECAGSESGLEPYLEWLLRTYPDFRGGLIESDSDELMRVMTGFGMTNECADIETITSMPAPEFKAALLDLRDRIFAGSGFRTFLMNGGTHTFIDGSSTPGGTDPKPPPGLVATAGGVPIATWLDQAINGGDAWQHAGDF